MSRKILFGCIVLVLALATAAPSWGRLGSPLPEEQLVSGPLLFVENVGQFPPEARFQVLGGEQTLWLARDALWVSLLEDRQAGNLEGSDLQEARQAGVHLRLAFPGANPNPAIEPFNRLATHVSYFTGHDRAGWYPDVPVWGGVRYRDLYPGLDLEITGQNGELIQRLVAQPGADVSAVRLGVEGADEITHASGYLRLSTRIGEFSLPLLSLLGAEPASQPIPLSMQPGSFEMAAPFAAESHSSHPARGQLPSILIFSTFLGGENYDQGADIAVNRRGDAYITGVTQSVDFPVTPGAFDADLNGSDVFVARLDRAGSSLIYATFLGGSDEDFGYGIAVDRRGAAYVTGTTRSLDYPTTPGSMQAMNAGAEDLFITKLEPLGAGLIYSSYLGGGDSDFGFRIAVDTNGSAYLTGSVHSPDFPITETAFDRTLDGFEDAYLVRLSPSGSELVYATFLGGGDVDGGTDIAVGRKGIVTLTGYTRSPDFPTIPGAYDESYGGSNDAFVARLNTTVSSLVYSTFLGGSDSDSGHSLAVDARGAAYVTGQTQSLDFPATADAFDPLINTLDAFVVKLNPKGSSLIYATFLGGEDYDTGEGIDLNRTGAAFVTVQTGSPDFPTTPDALDPTYNGGDGDVSIVKLNPTGSRLLYSTFVGGSGVDWPRGIAVGWKDAAVITGLTDSPEFPVSQQAFDRTYNGLLEAFVTCIRIRSR